MVVRNIALETCSYVPCLSLVWEIFFLFMVATLVIKDYRACLQLSLSARHKFVYLDSREHHIFQKNER